MLANAPLWFTGPALSVFHLNSISYFHLLFGQDRRVVSGFAYNTFLLQFALRLKMLGIAGVLRVVWMIKSINVFLRNFSFCSISRGIKFYHIRTF